MAGPTEGIDRSDAPYVIVSSDTHAGLPVDEYRDYLEASVHAEFDDWLRSRHQHRTMVEEVNGELDKHERLAGLVLVRDVWSVDNGFLTPTLKIKRNVVESTYGARFNEWAERREAVQWHD